MAAHARLKALLKQLDISLEYSEAAMAQANRLAQNPGIDDPNLVDRRDLPFCTIDEPSSKDLDQALFVERLRTDEGGHRVWYAIADAAYFVQPDTPLWEEALRRGSSYYLPGLVVPMLPSILSEGVVSLNPGVDRRALLFVVELCNAGRVVHASLERARIHSRAKLSYQGVQAWYDGQGPADCDVEVQASLRALEVVGKARLALALERGVVPFRRREVELSQDGEQGHLVAYQDLRRDVERYNEQISLLCNVQGARFLRKHEEDLHPIYRVHPSPAPERLKELAERIAAMVEQRGLDPQIWSRDGTPERLADWLGALPSTGPDADVAQMVHRQAVVSSGRAAFTSTPGGHHGVGADVYGRFTAPMRELVGVYLHGESCERLGGPTWGPEQDAPAMALRDRVIEVARAAKLNQKALDREANRLVLDQVMGADVEAKGMVREGVIMGMSKRKIYVRLNHPPLDVKVYLHHLEAQRGHRLSVDKKGVVLSLGDKTLFVLGDRVKIRAIEQDPAADRWVFHLFGERELPSLS